MNREQVKTLFKRIKVHYNTFKSKDQDVFDEWCRRLQDYRANGVFDNFDRYLKEQHDEPPKVIDLINEFIRIEKDFNSINCTICGRKESLSNYDKHFSRCNSIDYICRSSKKYFGQVLNKQKLWELSDEEFEDRYWKFCKKLVDVQELSDLEKTSLRNAILSHYGQEVDGVTFIQKISKGFLNGTKNRS